ncbi:MAG: heavy metal translocating P-type ATPase [Bifidobacteriaceae bacterium]|jgi:heavy metal translocating P-type ATPase|nr:heavy metal translocating P-type ATPase [Bifidobacteriaceae bacterium]
MKDNFKLPSTSLIFLVLAIFSLINLLVLPGQKAGILVFIICIITLLKNINDIIQGFINGQVGMDILAILAISSCLIIDDKLAAIVVVCMLFTGDIIEEYAEGKSKKSLENLVANFPTKVTVDGKKVDLSDVVIGDEVTIMAGEIIPIDMTLSSDSATIDTSSLTGESIPVTLICGESISSGTLNVGATFSGKVTKIASESAYQEILNITNSALETKAPMVKLADKYAGVFTIISLTIAGFAWAISGDFMRAAEVLVLATPCPLIIGVPVAFISGMANLSRNHIIAKNGAAIEKFSRIDAIFFDKTGTITTGNLVVTGFDSADTLQIAASLEQKSGHIFAHSILEKAASENLDLLDVDDVDEIMGMGLSGVYDGKHIRVGKESFVCVGCAHTKNNAFKIDDTIIKKHKNDLSPRVYVSVENKIIGAITFADNISQNAIDAISDFKENGITDLNIISGDKKEVVKHVAETVGIDSYYGELLPIEKVQVLQKHHSDDDCNCLMVGDGVNDAPVLASAFIGAAVLAKQNSAASLSADLILVGESIGQLFTGYQIAKNTRKIAFQSIMIGMSLSIVCMLIATTGIIPAVVGAIIQECIDVIAITNALRALKTVK